MPTALEHLRDRANHAGIFLDFDGSLSTIVPRPELARPVEGAREVLVALVEHYRMVAIVSGRPADELLRRLRVDGITYEGLYGLEEAASDVTLALLPVVEHAAAVVPEAWVEDKRISLAVHYRQAEAPAQARTRLVGVLAPIASDAGLELVEGKMVLELVPANRPMKGGAIERLAGEAHLQAALFAGDDVADLDAFAAMDRLAARGLITVKVAVRGDETPAELVDLADLAVEGPEGLVDLLGELS